MVKVLIVYHSRTGNTQKMAEYVKAGVEEAGALAILKRAEDTRPEDMNTADAVIIGSPTYYGLPAAEIKSLVDKSIKFHGEFEGKVGGAFASSANKGGGNETTIMAIIQALLIHGMIIPGSSKGDHYGPVSIGKPDEDVRIQCMNLGKRTVLVTSKLKASKTG
ncbi:MAG: flavodoxin family protein [Elusimicrobia bacterium]|nr:flavodoxin family protein [Elusimicrobiota bacterium]